MSSELKASQELNVLLAKQILNGIESQLDDADITDELVASLGDYTESLTPEDQKRFAEQISVFPAFMDACRAHDRACEQGNRVAAAQHMAEMKRQTQKSRQAMRYLGLTDAAEALVRARDLAAFCSILPSVSLDRTYGSGFSGTSPFPLIWALSARSRPLERVKLMLDAGARTDLRMRLGDTVLHAMARMRRKNSVRLKILKLLIAAGADLQARNIHGVTPLAVALDEGSEEDIRCFIDVGARIGQVELRFAAENPKRLSLILGYVSWQSVEDETKARFIDWLDEELVQAREHVHDAMTQGVGMVKLIEREKQLAASRDLIRTLR
ncbi:hypothetical protein MUY21_14620 [Aliiroseovarius sp. S2029]|uniref:ankyrin repeat domain-containing protein n=1 Tax=Aliiroseovarius sp. S2029 TaxID=2936988 RepID=UPI0020BFABB0|nr:ankyrin repeat domain-containing protein [Aliiroseovarius sp. S2029]MCK8485275.1 hypothetical protein [Aliiroseovarius sp. S2029]